MSEPIKLFRNGQEIVIAAPSQVQLLIREGWSVTPEDDVPFDIAADIEPTDDILFEIEEPEVQEVAATKGKRGRPKRKVHVEEAAE